MSTVFPIFFCFIRRKVFRAIYWQNLSVADATALPQRHALSVCFAATSPIGRGTGVPVRPTRDEQSLSYPETVVPCYRGQQLRDNIPRQAAVNLCGRALLFMIKPNFARPAWACPTRQCLSLWERCLRSRRRGQGRWRRSSPLPQRESLAERPVLCTNTPKTLSERGGLRAKREKIGFPLAKRGKTRYSIVTV